MVLKLMLLLKFVRPGIVGAGGGVDESVSE